MKNLPDIWAVRQPDLFAEQAELTRLIERQAFDPIVRRVFDWSDLCINANDRSALSALMTWLDDQALPPTFGAACLAFLNVMMKPENLPSHVKQVQAILDSADLTHPDLCALLFWRLSEMNDNPNPLRDIEHALGETQYSCYRSRLMLTRSLLLLADGRKKQADEYLHQAFDLATKTYDYDLGLLVDCYLERCRRFILDQQVFHAQAEMNEAIYNAVLVGNGKILISTLNAASEFWLRLEQVRRARGLAYVALEFCRKAQIPPEPSELITQPDDPELVAEGLLFIGKIFGEGETPDHQWAIAEAASQYAPEKNRLLQDEIGVQKFLANRAMKNLNRTYARRKS